MLVRCFKCRFWQLWKDKPEKGECRRHAPSPSVRRNDTEPHFPATKRNVWCGEGEPLLIGNQE